MKIKFTLVLIFFLGCYYLKSQENQKLDSLKMIVSSQSDSMKILTYSEIINLTLSFSPTKAKEYVNFQKGLAKKMRQEWAKGVSKMAEGNYYAATNNYSEAEDAYQIAKSIFENRKDSLNLSKAFNNLTRPLVLQGKYEKALAYCLDALRINESMNSDKTLLIGNYIAIGNIHSIMQQYNRSLEFYRKAETIAIEIGPELRLAQVRHNIGSNMMWLKRNNEGVEYFEKNLKFYERTKNDFRMQLHLQPWVTTILK